MCYTPTEKYAVRYKTVEECCPGWTDAGGGRCTIRMYTQFVFCTVTCLP